MLTPFITHFWAVVARVILRFRALFLLMLCGMTIFFIGQWKNVHFAFKEANMLPDHHPVNQDYQKFLKTFGEEGNLILLAVNDERIYQPEMLSRWHQLSKEIKQFTEIESVISTENLTYLVKDTLHQTFRVERMHAPLETSQQVEAFKKKLFDSLPFYEGLLFNKGSKTLFAGVYLKKHLVNTKHRKDFLLQKFIPLVQNFEKQTQLKVHISGMPYIRTLNSQTITGEIGLFIGGALFVTGLIFFLFFRSFRAMFIALVVVITAVMWAFGIIGLTGYKITILTAIIPPLIIVIGVPNCIFLINKYQSEFQKHKNQSVALQRVIRNIGKVTLLTNLTTAIGFTTFIFTESTLLKEFGIIAAINILAIFLLSLLLIPIIYSYLKSPREKHLKHLNKKWIKKIISEVIHLVESRRRWVFFTAAMVFVISLMGISRIRISGSLLEDMPQSADFFKDIRFFEKEIGGIMPLEITLHTSRRRGMTQLSTLKQLEAFEQFLNKIPEISSPISIVRVAKSVRQAFYNGNPDYYSLPSKQEQNFILPYLKGLSSSSTGINQYIDSTGQTARITTFMKDIGSGRMQHIEDQIREKALELFPNDTFEVHLTGSAYMFSKGTQYLISNLMISLAIAVLLIALLMAYMFRSARMILISLIPNILPLITTAAMMGFCGIPLKPSTILVFSIAFGISVDDTIHFLTRFRWELKRNKGKVEQSVIRSLSDTGISMFYTSVVLFFGFSVFILSNFGGTKALGGLVSFTLLIAMVSNLILLPSLLLSFNKKQKQSK